MRIFLLLLCSPALAQPGSLVFHNSTEGYHTFRIPSLSVTAAGTFLAFAEGRARNGFYPPHGDTTDCYGEGASAADWRCTNKDIVLKRSLDRGATFLPLACIAAANETHFYTNPQTLIAGSTIYLQFMRCVSPTNGGNAFVNCTAVMSRSEDDGLTFTRFTDISPVQSSSGGFGGVIARSGRLVFSAPGTATTGALLSDDGGASWRWGAPAAGGGGENQIAVGGGSGAGSLLMTVRRKNNTRELLRSEDGGETWGPAARQAVTDPDCQASMIRVFGSSGPQWLLFANPHTSGLLPYAEGRQNVTVQGSVDEGASWQPFFLVDSGPSAYTSLAQLRQEGRGPGSCGVLYEESGDLPLDFRSIRFVAFDCAPPTV